MECHADGMRERLLRGDNVLRRETILIRLVVMAGHAILLYRNRT